MGIQKEMRYLRTTIVFFLLVLSGCKRDFSPRQAGGENRDSILVEDKSAAAIESDASMPDQDLRRVKFYLENSGSMNGYANGNTDFKLAITSLLSDLALKVPEEKVKVNLVNTKIYPQKKPYSEFLKDLTTGGIPKQGDISNSDINLIFDSILSNLNNGDLAVLVTDAIYSLDQVSEGDLLGLLKTESSLTRNHFVNRLENSNISAQVVKLSSRFNGNYYPARGGKVKIDQPRPYYIWLFANNAVLKYVNNEIDIMKLPGYKESAIHIKRTDFSPDYSILAYGDGVLGEYAACDTKAYPITCIEYQDVSRYEFEGEFGFAVVMDLSDSPLTNANLEDISYYKTGDSSYEVYNVESLESAELKQTTLRHISNIEKETGSNFSHILYLKTSSDFLQKFKVSFRDLKPKWILSSSNSNDSEIKDDTETTFGFEYLYGGIEKAYEYVNDNEPFFSLEFEITN